MWQHAQLSKQICSGDALACCWDVKQTSKQPTFHQNRNLTRMVCTHTPATLFTSRTVSATNSTLACFALSETYTQTNKANHIHSIKTILCTAKQFAECQKVVWTEAFFFSIVNYMEMQLGWRYAHVLLRSRLPLSSTFHRSRVKTRTVYLQ